MRFDKHIGQASLVMAMVMTATACTSIDISQAKSARPKPAAAPAHATAPVAPALTSAVPAAPAAPKPVIPAEPPVNAAALRNFEAANRALKAGRIDEAERGYRSIIESNPELGGPHANLGMIYRNANKLPEALTEFNQAVRLNPRQPIYLNQLGITYRQMGQFEKARDAYERAIDADANYAPAILNLGILSDLYLGDSQRALELFTRYLALTPGGDTTVTKWITELKHRKPVSTKVIEKEKS
jgi:tetratricopeptide (TPR) repeat protein